MIPPYKNIHVIINPAAGKDEPILNILIDVFHKYDINWEIQITHAFGDATRMAREAAVAGVDLVVGYGGDGTQMEIAQGVKGTNTPMAILPGGTGNAMTFELGIPRDLRAAAELICTSKNRRKVDMGQIGDRYFMLRTYTGPQPEQVATRAQKDKYGVLAYAAAALRMARSLPVMNHRLTIDGQVVVEEEAFVCFIYNAGSLGGLNLPKPEDIDVGDGLLDVVLINKSLRSLRAATNYTIDFGRGKAQIHRWQGREITVETEKPQAVWIDGEAHGTTPFTAVTIPHAVQIVTP